MNKLRVVTVDDEPLALERVSALVSASPFLDLAGEARNGLEGLDLIAALQPDLVFMDVEMPELSGFGVVAALEPDQVPGVIFTTAFEHYAVKAFEVGAIDYLSKPVLRERFEEAVARATMRLENRVAELKHALIVSAAAAERERGYRARFVVRRGTTHYFVPVEEVDWIDVADNYLRLHTGDRIHFWRGTMTEAEEQLDPGRFARVHRSVIVALDRITSVTAAGAGHIIQLRTGMRLRSSRQYGGRVRALLDQ